MSTSPALTLLLMALAFFFIIPAVLQWLWNITMPDVFSLKEVTYWQSFRLIIISAILFSPGLIGFNS
ncbi:MAG: hypothetical protein LAT66_02860 [Alkalimonas sp.]|nr:hypothetical protein [Alkalimonas sp.]